MWSYTCRPCLKGDAGVVGVPGSVCVLLLLPLRCHRLLRAAHRDDGSGPAGVQPARVGPGNGGPRLVPWFSEDPSFLLGVTRLTMAGIQMTADHNDGKKKKEEQSDWHPAPISSPVPRVFSWDRTVASKEPASTVFM